MEKSRKVTKGAALYMLLTHVRTIQRIARGSIKVNGKTHALDGYAQWILDDCAAIGHWAKQLKIRPAFPRKQKRRQS
jgi:hypothetical protein